MIEVSDPMVEPQWLHDRLDDPHVLPIDASWWFPHEARDAAAEFAKAHIPGAGFFDIDAVADPNTDLPHMLPSPDAFAQAIGKIGVEATTEVVVYEAGAPRAAGRLWWTLRVFGHARVRVLDGGLPRWRAEGRPLQSGPAPERAGRFVPRFEPSLVRDADDMRGLIRDGGAQIADARPATRFRGEADEPRPGLRRGHMPGAHNLPANTLFDEHGRLLDRETLGARYTAAGLDPRAPIVATCGSGITAGMIALATARLGRGDTAVYDGSWAQWGALLDAPVEL